MAEVFLPRSGTSLADQTGKHKHRQLLMLIYQPIPDAEYLPFYQC